MEDYEKMVEYNIEDCFDIDDREFDWDKYQELCDKAAQWIEGRY